MNKSNISAIFLFFCLGTSVSGVLAQTETERVLQLEATVRELTLQTAKLLEENKRLSEAMKEALQAQRTGKPVVTGCNYDPLAFALINDSSQSGKLSTLKQWLNTNAVSCTKEQLKAINSNLTRWGADTRFSTMSDMRAAINYWLDR